MFVSGTGTGEIIIEFPKNIADIIVDSKSEIVIMKSVVQTLI
ncbi:MAG: hypothetical protein JWM59_1561 [Verrucomicrobiales bacterium]|nr:hypothetical protein [Verrucomicrobiales bacterium]